ncbi:hypothetical protein G6O67_004622 [Ophiocordyceps sinensis]|uniref:Myb/SANT-like domain-containing protein n=1 Tax=Ophiocordyceps sinensis TaxID=72228 RepID=A0A8H4PPW5_9HYPO|nr:hypothetical protein G6O67_004622 [Ophiocordyceps sinensis]
MKSTLAMLAPFGAAFAMPQGQVGASPDDNIAELTMDDLDGACQSPVPKPGPTRNMSEDDIDILGPDGFPATELVCERRTPRFSWTPAYETTFFRSLCDSVQLGLRENSSFKAEAWGRAAQALQKSHGAYPTKSHLINKSDNARKRFRLWRGLREHPDFLYNPHTRVVTASKEAWNARIEKEPLSRALRNRPFEHEDFMEILYPDVIGSGGVPKRIMKPRRRADELDEMDVPGTGILNLQLDPTTGQPVDNADKHRAYSIQPITDSATGAAARPQRPTSVTLGSRTALVQSPSAQTPPDESTNQFKKRALPHETAQDGFGAQPLSSSATPGSALQSGQSPEKRARTSAQGDAMSKALGAMAAFATAPSSSNTTPLPANGNGSGFEELDAARGRPGMHWQEAALEAFFKDFSDQDPDLQLMISEAVLCDEYKALLFCKMPWRVRQHWVARLGEMYVKPT